MKRTINVSGTFKKRKEETTMKRSVGYEIHHESKTIVLTKKFNQAAAQRGSKEYGRFQRGYSQKRGLKNEY